VQDDKLLIMLTTGPEDRGNRATLAFAMGTSALISGVDTTIYLTMGGTFWSRRRAIRKVHIDGFDPLETYVQQYVDAGGSLMVCSPCNEFYCSISGDDDVLEGAEFCGLATIVDLALNGPSVTL
jgi:predicted peroxiredoxin